MKPDSGFRQELVEYGTASSAVPRHDYQLDEPSPPLGREKYASRHLVAELHPKLKAHKAVS